MRAGRAVLSAMALVGALLATPSVADAAAPVFTWSGAAEAASGDARTSTPANWAGGVAPAPGQRVALVLPALQCVSIGTCDRLANDVPDLVVTSLSVTVPGAPPPGPYVTQGAYSVSGEGIRLTGPLTTAVDLTTGPVPYGLDLRLPLELVGDDAGSWRLQSGVRIGSTVTGRSLKVVTLNGGSLSVESRRGIEVERFSLRGGAHTGFTSVYAAAIGARSRTPVVFRGAYVDLAGASLGPLTVRDAEIEVSDPSTSPPRSPVTRVRGDVRLGSGTSLYVRELGLRHPSLRADGTVRLGGAELVLIPYDCRDTAPGGSELTLVSGAQITGLLSGAKGRPLGDGAVITLPADDYCGRTRLRVGYSTTAVTLTVLSQG